MLLLLIPVVFLALLYVVAVLPQQRRVRAHEELVRSLEVGQEVMTTSGVYGRLIAVGDDTVHLEVAPGVQVKIARASVGLIAEAPSGIDEGPMVDQPAPGGDLT